MEQKEISKMESRILYKSGACAVVNKLAGEAVEGEKEGIVNLARGLSGFWGLNEDVVQAVHRLDVPVTGCTLFALTKPAFTLLADAFAGKNNLKIEKIYWAVIEKPLRAVRESGDLIHWIETDTKHNKSYAHNEYAAGRKKAALRYKITGEGINYLFTQIELLSGRHHQIRAQFAKEGLHIKGDLKYGAKRSEKSGGIRLHARSLEFPDPLNAAETIRVTADPPVLDNLWKEFFT